MYGTVTNCPGQQNEQMQRPHKDLTLGVSWVIITNKCLKEMPYLISPVISSMVAGSYVTQTSFSG